MGGGGFAADAVNSMRANRLLRKKGKFKDTKNLVIETSGKTEVEFKQVSADELAAIKIKIRENAKRTAKRDIVIYGSCAVILFILIGYLTLRIING